MVRKIVVVEDEPELLKVTLLRLNRSGYEAFGAANGEESLAMARRMMPDLILLDVYLPKLRGDEVVRLLKSDEKTKRIPVVLISAVVETLEATAGECGAEACLPKPFETEALRGIIGKCQAAGAK